MIISDDQMQQMRQRTETVYVHTAAQRLGQFFPRHARAMHPDALTALVGAGIGRARQHRLHTERGIQTYLSLMVYLGSGFDRDPQYPWAAAVLDDPSDTDETSRIDEIIRCTGLFLAKVAGPDREHVSAALKRLSTGGEVWFTQLERPVNGVSLRRLLNAIYPEKVAYLGNDRLTEVMTLALNAARRHGLDGPEPVALFAGLFLLLGSFADEDPQFGWIPQALAPRDTDDSPNERFDRLLDVAFGRLRAWLQAS